MSPLIGGHGDGLCIFFDGTVHDLVYRAVVSQMDDFATRALQDAAHDVDGGVVAVKKGGGGDDADGVAGLCRGGLPGVFGLRCFHARFNGAPQR